MLINADTAKQMTDRMLQDDYEGEIIKIEALISKAIKEHKYCIRVSWDLSTKMKDKLRELGYNVMGREVSWYKPKDDFNNITYIEKHNNIFSPIGRFFNNWFLVDK